MKRFFTKKRILALAVIAALLIAWGIYARPFTLAELEPEMKLTDCTEIRIRYRDGKAETVAYTMTSSDPRFAELYALLTEQTYRRRLWGLLPHGTRSHMIQEGDHHWDVDMVFRHDPPLELPSGSASLGGSMQVQYWYGEVDLYDRIGGYDHFLVSTPDREAWARQVLELLMKDE